MKKEIEPLGQNIYEGQKFFDLMISSKFQDRLDEMIRDSLKSEDYLETGYWMLVNPNENEFSMSRMDVSEAHGIGMSLKKMAMIKNKYIKKGMYPLLTIHSHPQDYIYGNYGANAFMPSRGDLENNELIKTVMFSDFGMKNAEILNIILIATGKNTARLLMYQAGTYSPNSEAIFEEYRKSMWQCDSEKEILECLNDFGYIANYINYPFINRSFLNQCLSKFSIDLTKNDDGGEKFADLDLFSI